MLIFAASSSDLFIWLLAFEPPYNERKLKLRESQRGTKVFLKALRFCAYCG